MIYRCIKEFTVPYVDKYGEPTSERMAIREGSIWWQEEDDDLNEICLTTDSDVRLWLVPENGDWIEITFERLDKYFKLQEVEQ